MLKCADVSVIGTWHGFFFQNLNEMQFVYYKINAAAEGIINSKFYTFVSNSEITSGGYVIIGNNCFQ